MSVSAPGVLAAAVGHPGQPGGARLSPAGSGHVRGAAPAGAPGAAGGAVPALLRLPPRPGGLRPAAPAPAPG